MLTTIQIIEKKKNSAFLRILLFVKNLKEIYIHSYLKEVEAQAVINHHLNQVG